MTELVYWTAELLRWMGGMVQWAWEHEWDEKTVLRAVIGIQFWVADRQFVINMASFASWAALRMIGRAALGFLWYLRRPRRVWSNLSEMWENLIVGVRGVLSVGLFLLGRFKWR